MTDIGANIGQAADPYLGVHVGTVEIDLTTVRVDDVAYFADVLFEDALGRGIGDHHGRQSIAMCLGLGLEILQIEIPPCVGAKGDDFAAGHDRARRVGSVRSSRNQADVALSLPSITVVGPNEEETR